jgi:hypothetical protein
MSSCEQIRDVIPLFPDDLDASEATLVREHVASCAPCAAELGVYAAQSAVFARAREGRGRVSLYAGIQAKLHESPAQSAQSARITAFPRRPLYAAAAAALVLGLGLLALRSGNNAPRPIQKTDDNNVALNKPVETPAPRTQPTQQAPRPARHGFGHRNFFDSEGATPYRLADSVELVPLDEEAEVPQTPSKTYAAPPAAHPAPKGGDEDRSLSF